MTIKPAPLEASQAGEGMNAFRKRSFTLRYLVVSSAIRLEVDLAQSHWPRL